MDTIGQRMIWARETAGLNILQAARFLDIPPNVLYAIEQDAQTLEPLLLDAASRVYDIRKQWIFDGQDKDLTGDADYKVNGDVDPEELARVRLLISRVRQDTDE